MRPGPSGQHELRPGAEVPPRPNAARAQARPSQPTEATTTRFSVPANSETNTARPPTPTPPAPPPSAGQTRAIPVPGNRESNSDPADPTTALPVMRSEGNDSDAATEKMNAGGQSDNGDTPRPRRRAGGGLSAQDLLRREGRL
jgi:RND superfamily putative drug exporter